MSYQVLARKYRPRTFDQMVGQTHVLRALINALTQNRLHHAYLFTGTRGVGKTSLARLFAKCLNCETGITAHPCETCRSCEEINAGRFIDLLEVDAASRTKVEDTRELLENVQYAPTRGRYKVYLIDEVHMLSGHSFNALLKTLEEPPPHVKFLLATTDPQRLPVTVLSRCLQFNLKNLPPEQITTHLENILTLENIPFELPALKQLARAANGSVRDALSLLDQAIAFSEHQVTAADVSTMLGSIEQIHIFALITALISNDAKEILELIMQLADQAAEFAQVLEDLLSVLHRIALMQIVPEHTDEDQAKIALFAQQISKEDLQLYYQIGLIGRRDLPLAPTARSGFEMIMLRMLAFRPTEDKIAANVTFNTSATSNTSATAAAKTAAAAPAITMVPQQSVSKPIHPSQNTEWPNIVNQLNLTGFSLALAMNCSLQEITDNQINLLLDPAHAAMRNPKQEARINDALRIYFGKSMTLHITIAASDLPTPSRLNQQHQSAQLNAAKQALTEDHNIQAILQTFGATIQPDSIQTKN